MYTHRFTKGYPADVDTTVSDEGYGANEYIETDKPIVVVTGPGPNSGKLATADIGDFSIVDDEVVREAAVQEVIRRYFRYSCEHAMGIEERKAVQRVELLMKDLAELRGCEMHITHIPTPGDGADCASSGST